MPSMTTNQQCKRSKTLSRH